VPSKSFSPRKSKLDQFRDIVGTLSDKDVAQRAGVTSENVRTYRLRRGIPAGWRGETSEQLLAKRSPDATKAKKTAAKPRKRRASALDPFQDRLGRIPDRRLAELAGVSAENVRAYRKRHGIPAFWRGDGASGTNGGAGPAPARATPTPKRSTEEARRFAYKVSAEVQGTTREYVAFGTDMAEAAAVATRRLADLHPGAMLRTISVVGVAL